MRNNMEKSKKKKQPNTFLEELRKIKKNHIQDSQSPGSVPNSGPPEYEAGVLTIQPRCPVC
jgi:hypothetical protein